MIVPAAARLWRYDGGVYCSVEANLVNPVLCLYLDSMDPAQSGCAGIATNLIPGECPRVLLKWPSTITSFIGTRAPNATF